jgi:signal transduction histidine kinase
MPWMMRIYFTVSLQALLLLFFSLSSIAADAPLYEQDGVQVGAIHYLEDREQVLDLSRAHALLQTARATRLDSSLFNLGSVDSQYWLGFELNNTTQQLRKLRLLASVAYRKLLDAYLVGDRSPPIKILHDSHALTFDERPSDYRYLGSESFSLAPGEQAYILIQYQAIGSSYLPLSIETEQGFRDILYSDSVQAAFFYSFSIAAIIVFLLFGLAMMDRTTAMYSGLFVLGLLFIASMEGYGFKYLWPDYPRWNHFSPLVLQLLVSGFGLLVSWVAAQPDERRPWIRQSMVWLALLSFVLIIPSFYLPFTTMAYMASACLGLMFLSQGYAQATWMRFGQKRNAVAIVAGVLLAVLVTMLVLLSFDASIVPGYVFVYSTRAVYTLASLATMATIVAHVSGLRQDHEKALENELVMMKREAEINKALYEAEQNYSKARELAHYRREQLATASHDMRQPLMSLRSTIDAIALNESGQVKTQLRNAFDYLENLCSDYLRDTRPEPEVGDVNDAFSAPPPAIDDTVEPYAADLVLDTTARMFSDEAAARGLRFRSRGSRVLIDRPPLILMRIVTNLVSNAVKHTASGTILLGARRRPQGLEIQVLDSGPGMDAEQLARLSQAYEKGPESGGEGLGMAICFQLAEQHGMRLDIQSSPGQGTCCRIHIPRVN